MRRIFIFIISAVFGLRGLTAQETESPLADSLAFPQKYGLRVGADLFMPGRTIFDDDYTGFEIVGDYRVSRKFYAAAELGNEQKTTFDDNLTSKGSGSYVKIGFDYNAHENWPGLNNAIYAGLRYGMATFNQELLEYSIATQAPVFPPDIRTESVEYSGLNAQWVEVVVGVKTEVLNNLFLYLNLQLKNLTGQKEPDNFENLYIPGFGRTWRESSFGAGFGYGISYLIPIYKK